MSTFKKCGASVVNMANDLLTQFESYKPLLDAKVKFDFAFAYGPRDEHGQLTSPALNHNGYPARGLAKKTSTKDRVFGRADCEVLLDGDWWDAPETTESQRKALLDHELNHFLVVMDEDGVKLDCLRRPQIEIRKHDFQVGWFTEIAERWGEDSQERIQARQILSTAGQMFWPELLDPQAHR